MLEWPQIEELRRAYFDARGQAVQRRPEGTAWFVARAGERVVGVYATLDYPELGQRYITDLYRVPGRVGTRALAAMTAAFMADACRARLDLVGTVDPANQRQMRAIQARGGVAVGVVFRWVHLRPEEL